jgi:hypothetical protein
VCHSDDWPDAFIKDCCAAGLLSQADDAAHIECPFCYDHHALAISTVWVGRKRTLLGTCPEAGVQSVAAELVKQYRPQEAGLRALIAGALGRRGVDAAGLAGDEPLGHLLHQGQDYTVMLARSTPDWKRVTKGNPRLIALTVEADRLDEVPPAVTVVALDRLITWNAKQGVCCTLTGLDDLLPTSLASTGGVELDGFQADL